MTLVEIRTWIAKDKRGELNINAQEKLEAGIAEFIEVHERTPFDVYQYLSTLEQNIINYYSSK